MADDHKTLLKRIANAITENPRYTTQELAASAGISRATLHRFGGTRENLEALLIESGEKRLSIIIRTAQEECTDYLEGLNQLIKVHYEEHEILQAFFTLRATCSQKKLESYFDAMNDFFLRGQNQGAFRIDLTASFLTTAFTSSFYGIINAQNQGRVARIGITEEFERFFISGAGQNTHA